MCSRSKSWCERAARALLGLHDMICSTNSQDDMNIVVAPQACGGGDEQKVV